MDEIQLMLIAALMNSIFSGLALYLGLRLGSRKTVSDALDALERRSKESPTAQRALKFFEKIDELFKEEIPETDDENEEPGEPISKFDKLINNVIKFFEDAGELVSSDEAKNFFKNVTELMKDLGGESEVKIKLPTKNKKKEVSE